MGQNCKHNFIQKDANWKSCTHCGMLEPLFPMQPLPTPESPAEGEDAEALIERFKIKIGSMKLHEVTEKYLSKLCAIEHCNLIIERLDKIQKESSGVFLNGQIRYYENLKETIKSK